MKDSIVRRSCNTGEYDNIVPIINLSSIKDLATGKTLDSILEQYNHIYVPFKDNSRSNTRLQVPANIRRKGLWITYVSCKGNAITEWYNSDDYSNKAWQDGKNWVPYLDNEVIAAGVKEALSWYKA